MSLGDIVREESQIVFTTSSVKPVRIHWVKAKCTNCLSCVVVCSERNTGMSAPSRARIRIHVELLGSDYSADYCRQCANAPCAAVCPEEAIQFDDTLRAWIVDIDQCTGCAECVQACPFEAMWLDSVVGKAIKCDLCGGTMRCVEICPSDALVVRGQPREVRDGK